MSQVSRVIIVCAMWELEPKMSIDATLNLFTLK